MEEAELRCCKEWSSAQHQRIQEIQDICQGFDSGRISQVDCDVCFGYLTNSTCSFKHGLYWPLKPLVDQVPADTMTLGSVMRQGRCRMLSMRQKRVLGAAMAMGTLQFYDTPWLDKQWCMEDITIFESSGRLVAEHPFLSLKDGHISSLVRVAAPRFTPCRLIRQETIFALGIFLIELVLDKPFVAMKLPEDSADGTTLADFYAADRLLQEVYHQAGPRYGDIVRRCIRFEFDHYSCDLEDPDLLGKIFTTVVGALEQEVENLT